MRNVKTGEIVDADTSSAEYRDMINQVYDHDGTAKPMWEITGEHHADRIDEGDINEQDIGEQFKPIPGMKTSIKEVGPEKYPHRALTEAEVESGITSWAQKAKDLGFDVSADDAEALERASSEERSARGRKAAGSSRKKSSSGSSSESTTEKKESDTTETSESGGEK